jgi:hypothetical protein
VGAKKCKNILIMKKNFRFFTLLGLMLSCLAFSCQQEKDEPVLTLEYSSDLDWLEEQGYVPLDETHENYDYIISLLQGTGNEPNQVNTRAVTCQWDDRPQNAFDCDSGSGGTCTVFVQTGSSTLTACLVCVGGDDNGNADCF